MSRIEKRNLPCGINFRSQSNVPLRPLSELLCKIAYFLQSFAGADVLVRYDDWLEHDGLQFQNGTLNIHDLFQIVGTPRSLLDNTPDDDYVNCGIGPNSGEWYLRFRAEWTDDGHDLVGRFDLTLSVDLAVRFRGELAASVKQQLTEESAEAYFRRIIA